MVKSQFRALPLQGTSMTRLARLLPVAIAAMTLLGPRTSFAQDLTSRKRELFLGSPVLEKVSSHLLEAREMKRKGMATAELNQAMPGLRFKDDQPEIEVRLRELTVSVEESLRAAGMTVTAVYPQYGRAYGTADPRRSRGSQRSPRWSQSTQTTPPVTWWAP